MSDEVEDEELEESPSDDGSWLTSYADLMTLVACFFILMVAFANFEDPTFQRRAQEFSRYFRGSLIVDDGEAEEDTIAESKIEIPVKNQPTENQMKVEKKKDRLTIINEFESIANISQIETPKDIQIIFTGSAMFRPGSVDVTETVKQSLLVMSDVLKQRRDANFIIVFEGHTDDTDISNQVYPSNWELSSARASRVLKIFENEGFDPRKLVAVGYGDSRPMYQNRNENGQPIESNRRLNRRVVIKVLSSKEGSIEALDLGVFFRVKKKDKNIKIKLDEGDLIHKKTKDVMKVDEDSN